jgi:uncharacterized protein (TIGR02271 family)
MNRTPQQWQIPEGTDVYGADGDKVGKVVAAESSYIVVEKGFFFPTDYYIPMAAISNFDGDKAYLSVTKDEALNQGWDQARAASDYDVGYGAPATDYGAVGTAPPPNTAEGDRLAGITPTGLSDEVNAGATDATLRGEPAYTGEVAPGATGRRVETTEELNEGEVVRVPVHEEELTATRRPAERGRVRVDKDVVAEERTMDVPVTEEKVMVNRRSVDREVPADADAFKEETIEIPVSTEEVDIQKRNRVVGEVDITKKPVTRTERVADTVRREEVHVEDSTGGTTEASS